MPFNVQHKESLVEWINSPNSADGAWKSVLRQLGALTDRADVAEWGSLAAHPTVREVENWISRHGKQSPLLLHANDLLDEAKQWEKAQAEIDRAEREAAARQRAEDRERDAKRKAAEQQDLYEKQLAEANERRREAERSARESGQTTRRVVLAGTVLIGAGGAFWAYQNSGKGTADSIAADAVPKPRSNSISVSMRSIKIDPLLVLGDGTGIYDAVYSPSGEHVLGAGSKGLVRVWNSATGDLVDSWAAHEKSIQAVAYSSDGSQIATGSTDGSVRIWEAQRDKPVIVLDGHGIAATAVVFSPDGSQVISGANGVGGVRLWDTRNGRLLRQIDESGGVQDLSYSPDGRYVLAAFFNGSVAKIWDARTFALVRSFESTEAGFQSASYSPDSKRILTTANLGETRTWDPETGTPGPVIAGPGRRARAVYSPDGATILIGDGNGRTWLFDAQTEARIARIQGHDEQVAAVSFNNDGSQFFTASVDGFLKTWSVSAAG